MLEKILLVDDEQRVLHGYMRSLRRKYRLDIASSGAEALKMIEHNGPYAVVVSDMRMPGMNGLELLTAIKEKQPDTVRIMLTGNADQKTAVDAVNKGEVFKFLTKPCSNEVMAEALESGLSNYRMTIEHREVLEQSVIEVQLLTERLIYQEKHDELTGLPNRRALELRMQSCIRSAKDEHKSHTLCYLDLDHFHVINDISGYFAGDECLRQIANLLSSQKREGDMVARLDANQFSILLQETPITEGERIVNKIHKLIRQYKFAWEEELFDVNASIGVIAVESDSKSIAALLSACETACNVAKDNGGDDIHVASPHDHELTRRLDESQWVSKINLALKDNRYELYYQTISPIGHNVEEKEHYEILIRMIDKDGNVISPASFLPAAENCLLSPQIDRWVVKHAVEWFNTHPNQLERLSVCSINLSGHSFGKSEMLKFILHTFDKGRIPPEKICFEITETAAISQFNAAIYFITTLKKRGFRFSLDDFGSGFSSFAYLKNFPVDYLKIDGQFVKQIHKDPVDRAMVKSINEIGKLMGKKTIAEFVENKNILKILGEIDVDFAQGYYLAKPRRLADKNKHQS